MANDPAQTPPKDCEPQLRADANGALSREVDELGEIDDELEGGTDELAVPANGEDVGAAGCWRPVQPDEILPSGCHVRMNVSTGVNEVFEPVDVDTAETEASAGAAAEVVDLAEHRREVIARAAKLPRLDLAVQLKDLAKQVGISVGDLRAAIKEQQQTPKPKGAAGGSPAPGHSRRYSQVLPELVIDNANLPETVKQLRSIMAGAENIYDRGRVPVLMLRAAEDGALFTKEIVWENVVMLAHEHCRPVGFNPDGTRKDVTLPKRVAQMYLALGEWGLQPLAGITAVPVMNPDGSIERIVGYSRRHMLWCEAVPDLKLPDRPTVDEAKRALLRIRNAFRTFPFKNAPMIDARIRYVDTSQPPGMAETCFLNGLLTAVARPSLWLVPGLVMNAPLQSGSGNGKGLLARCICWVAFGCDPELFSPGHDRDEMDKRLVSGVLSSRPMLCVDNVNATALRSNTLASLQTERPSNVRLFGRTGLVPVNSAVFFVLTGNGLTLSEDLCRRNLPLELDAEMEDAERRYFPKGFLAWVKENRTGRLADCLTILRWGRQNPDLLQRGLALGGFEDWSEWVRDPLLTLECRDPVNQIIEAKKNDPLRRLLNDLFEKWAQLHGTGVVKASDLHEDVLGILNPAGRSRQWVAQRLIQLTGTRAAGLVLTRASPSGKWSADTYALVPAVGTLGKPATGAPRLFNATVDEGSWPAAIAVNERPEEAPETTAEAAAEEAEDEEGGADEERL
jgi:hypothetical protein